jgi:type VI protein secretion system component VasK
MSKEDWEREREILKGMADRIFTVSILLGEVVIWLLVTLLVYSEFILGESISKNITKMIVVGVITGILIWLAAFMIIRARRRLRSEIENDEDGGDRDGKR